MCAASHQPDRLSQLIDTAVIQGQLATGRSVPWIAARTGNRRAVAVLSASQGARSPQRARRAADWSKDDDDFLRANLGWLSEAEIARHLGRTVTAVHLRWKRDLKLPAPSKHPDFITTQKIAEALGVDPKAAMRWVDMGLLPGRRLPFVGRVVRSVRRVTFLLWALDPMNWIYFRPQRVPDKRLRRLLRLKQKRWSDEWLTPGQVARLHGVTDAAVNSKIHSGEIRGLKWGNWRILRSEATRPGLRFFIGKGSTGLDWSEAADAFLILAHAVGFSTNATGRMMGGWPTGRVPYRLRELHRQRMIPRLIRKYGLKVWYRPNTGALLADWKDYSRRFKRLAQAMDRFLAGKPLRDIRDVSHVRGVLRAWATWHARTPQQHRFARRLTTASHSRLETLQYFLAELRKWGINPSKRLRTRRRSS